jgi:hypothetical protein
MSSSLREFYGTPRDLLGEDANIFLSLPLDYGLSYDLFDWLVAIDLF